jgi:hypothetical protein
MTNRFDADLPPDLDDSERAALLSVAERLESERPVIRAMARGEIRRGLSTQPSRFRPRHLRRLVTAFAATGVLLLAVAGALGLQHEEHPVGVDASGRLSRPTPGTTGRTRYVVVREQGQKAIQS